MKKLTLFLAFFLTTSCSINPQPFVEVDKVDTFNLDNYSDFYININEVNLSSDINPIALERFRDDLKNALVERGLLFNQDSNLVFEINITSKDEIESDNFNNYYARYGWDRYYRDDIKTISKFALRINLKDVNTESTLWTVYGDWRKGSKKSPTKDDGSNALVDEIMLSF